MEFASVTSDGRVTIPKEMRERLGIHEGSTIRFVLASQHIEHAPRSSDRFRYRHTD